MCTGNCNGCDEYDYCNPNPHGISDPHREVTSDQKEDKPGLVTAFLRHYEMCLNNMKRR